MMGMSYREYWHESPWLTQAYYKANRLRNEVRNQELWLQGLYIYNALNVVIANAFKTNSHEKYIEKPIDIYPKSKPKQEEEDEKNRQQLALMLNAWKREWEKNSGNKK